MNGITVVLALVLGLAASASAARPALPRAAATESLSIVPIGVRPPALGGFVAGCTEYALVDGPAMRTQGTYIALDLSAISPGPCGGEGAPFYRCAWSQGIACRTVGTSCVPPLAGNVVGSTAQGIQARFTQDTDQRPGICYDDYHGNGARWIVAPLLDGSSGGCPAPVVRLCVLFLSRPAGGAHPEVIACEFLGELDPTPVAASPVTWGSLKLRYR